MTGSCVCLNVTKQPPETLKSTLVIPVTVQQSIRFIKVENPYRVNKKKGKLCLWLLFTRSSGALTSYGLYLILL